MSSIKKVSGVALAVAAASLFSAAPAVIADGHESAEAKVHCYGVNICKGHNDCKTATNACAGLGSCQGLGFVAVSEKACADIGGTVGE